MDENTYNSSRSADLAGHGGAGEECDNDGGDLHGEGRGVILGGYMV